MATHALRPSKPSPINADEMHRYLRTQAPGLRVYNPSHEWLNPEVHGRTDVWLPPDLGGASEPHPLTGQAVVCDGVGEIRGRFATRPDSSGKVPTGMDAESALAFLMTRYNDMGLVYLPGRDPGEDDRLREWSRETFASYQMMRDQEVVDRRQAFVTAWKAAPANANKPVPPPTEREMAAMDRLAATAKRRAYRYECDFDGCPGYAQNDWDRFARHMLTHGLKVERAEYEELTGTEPAKVKRTRLRKAEPATGEV